jgi:hypothetical protein
MPKRRSQGNFIKNVVRWTVTQGSFTGAGLVLIMMKKLGGADT